VELWRECAISHFSVERVIASNTPVALVFIFTGWSGSSYPSASATTWRARGTPGMIMQPRMPMPCILRSARRDAPKIATFASHVPFSDDPNGSGGWTKEMPLEDPRPAFDQGCYNQREKRRCWFCCRCSHV